MADPNGRCPVCGAEFPAAAGEQPCPACLMQLGLESWQARSAAAADAPPTVLSPGGFVPPAVDEIASRFPQLEVLELLGHGGMGAVYKVRQIRLDRIVALKIIKPEAAGDPGFAERFAREARTLARLGHPNIVTIHDFGQADGLYYFLMELVDGVTLRQLLADSRLEPQQALAIVPPICEALQYAHDEGVVHRDIKPENILIDSKGRVKIADFGLAKLVRGPLEDVSLTGTHQVMGTPRYMAPEQMEGARRVDHRADIYSLGVVFYEMLTGELPIGRFEPPSKRVRVDVRLDEVVLRTLEREPERRYQQASHVKGAVERVSGRPGPAVWRAAELSAVPAEEQAALDRVGRPAFGLIVTGILYWLTIPLAFALWSAGAFGPDVWLPASPIAWFFCVQPALAGALLMFGGFQMQRLEAYRVCLLAAAAPLVILVANPIVAATTDSFGFSPGDLVGAPMGLWALVVLTRRDVRAAFAARAQGPPLVDAGDAEQVRRDLRGPATGLIVTGVVNWIGIPLAVLALSSWVSVRPPDELVAPLAVAALAAAGAMVAAGMLMRRLRARRFAMTASVLAMLVSPGSLIGLPVGIWSLVVLTQPEIREAFRRRPEPASTPKAPRQIA